MPRRRLVKMATFVRSARSFESAQSQKWCATSRANISLTPSCTSVSNVTTSWVQELLWQDIFSACIKLPYPIFDLSQIWNKYFKCVDCVLLGPFSKPEDFNQYVSRNEAGIPMCSICHGFVNKAIVNVVNHIESKHFPSTFSYSCPNCHRIVATRKALQRHLQKCGVLSIGVEKSF